MGRLVKYCGGGLLGCGDGEEEMGNWQNTVEMSSLDLEMMK